MMKLPNLAAAVFYIASFGVLSSAHGQGTLLLNDYPQSYTVAEDDTLWTIASQFLQNPERWPEIWRPDPYLDNADLIYPGDTLSLNFVGGSPQVMVQRGDRDVQRLGPEIREIPLSSAIPAISLESIENSFTRNRIVSQELFEAAPYILESLGASLAISAGDEVYARGSWPFGTSSFEVYRQGRVYEGDEGEFLGLELEYVGFASIVEETSPDLRRLIINNSSKEIRVGDRLLIREEARLDTTIFPTEPTANMDGEIVGFLSGEAMASQLDTAVVNLGQRDNLEVGDVLAVRGANARVVDEVERSRLPFRERMRAILKGDRVELPGEEIGTLLVYKTFEQFSYALILSSLEPLEVNTRVTTP